MNTKRSKIKSQCPRGHFCFFHSADKRYIAAATKSLNALAGIFVFSTVAVNQVANFDRASQCPRGHFCFFHSTGKQKRPDSSMSQCPRGHFCFFHRPLGSLFRLSGGTVSMPSRAFLFFPPG